MSLGKYLNGVAPQWAKHKDLYADKQCRNQNFSVVEEYVKKSHGKNTTTANCFCFPLLYHVLLKTTLLH